jgi:hypothetical protein
MPDVRWVTKLAELPTREHGFAFESIGGELVATLGRPPRSQRKTAVVSVGVELDRQDLVKLNDIRLEAQP